VDADARRFTHERHRQAVEIAAQQMIDVAFAAPIEMTDCDRAFWAMIGQWKSIVITAKTDEEKRSGFLGILQYHIDYLAHAREGHGDTPLVKLRLSCSKCGSTRL
jgi:hypothetical protein